MRSSARLADAVHHRHRRLHPLPMRHLHDPEPPRSAPSSRATCSRTAARGSRRRRPGCCRAPRRAARAPRRPPQAEALAKKSTSDGREPMDVDRVIALDVAHQVEIPLERDVRVVPALHQDLHAAERLALVDLGADLLEGQRVAFVVLGPAVERAEAAIGDADVRVVDVAVDDVRDRIAGMLPPPLGFGRRRARAAARSCRSRGSP